MVGGRDHRRIQPGSPDFRRPFRTVPDVEIVWEQTSDQLVGSRQMIVWVKCDDFETFETAIESDPGTQNPEMLSEADNQRLYRVDLNERGLETILSLKTNEVGGILQRAVG